MCEGDKYETKVRWTLTRAAEAQSGFSIVPDRSSASNAHKPDVTLIIDGQRHNFEVKKDMKAQMGGTSLNYSMESGLVSFVDASGIPLDIRDRIIEEATSLTGHVDRLIRHVKTLEPIELHKNITGTSMVTGRDAWEKLQEAGYLAPINLKIPYNTDIIKRHYAKKNTHYIQIGRMGLYYMEQNPLDLPIPQLQGDADIELRLRRSGSTMSKLWGTKTATAVFAVQGRIKTLEKSPISLDNYNDCIEVFRKV